MVAVEFAGQYEPALHRPEQAASRRPIVEPYVPAGHAVESIEPVRQYEPLLHIPEHDAVCKPVNEPYVPAGQGIGAVAKSGQYELMFSKIFTQSILDIKPMKMYVKLCVIMSVRQRTRRGDG